MKFSFVKDFICFLEKREEKEKERERERKTCGRNVDLLPLARPHLGTWSITQACTLSGSQITAFQFAEWCPTHSATPSRADNNEVLR